MAVYFQIEILGLMLVLQAKRMCKKSFSEEVNSWWEPSTITKSEKSCILVWILCRLHFSENFVLVKYWFQVYNMGLWSFVVTHRWTEETKLPLIMPIQRENLIEKRTYLLRQSTSSSPGRVCWEFGRRQDYSIPGHLIFSIRTMRSENQEYKLFRWRKFLQ